jgi:hypothetical protein
MKLLCKHGLCFFLIALTTAAQTEFNFSGYVSDIPVLQLMSSGLAGFYNTKKIQFVNLSRVRLNSSASFWKNSRLETEYEISALYYSSDYDPGLSTTGKTNRQLLRLKWNPVNENHFSFIHFIDRLYFRQGFKRSSITLGRQRISWGTGRVWNPTDLFNPINPASYYKEEKDGADAASAKIAFGNFTDLNLVFNPLEKISASNYGARFRTNFSKYDVSVMAGYFDKRIIAGADFAGNLLDAGIRGEGIVSVNKESSGDKFVKFILGIDNQFTSQLYGLIEYHFNGEGKTDKFEYDFQRLAKGEIQNVGKNYICLSSNYQLNALTYFTLTNITNLNDGSGFVNLLGTFSALDNLTLSIGIQTAYGSKYSEYWYYPASFYGIGKFYF